MEILFRGKRIDNGEWVEGDLIHEKFGVYIQYIINNIRTKAKVDPETICEYINSKDQDKTLAFTNDIVEFSHYTEFGRSGYYVGFIYKGDGCYKISTKTLIFYIDDAIDIDKVIGNKFDNAELLSK